MNKSFLDKKKTTFLQKQNGNFGFWYHLGNDYLNIHEAAEAIECYEKAIKIDPLIFETYSHIGDAYLQLDKLLNALIYYKKSVDIQPQYGTGWYNLGYACNLSSDMAQCLYCYEKAIHSYILPFDDSYYIMGRTFLKENDLEKAWDALNLALNSVSAKSKKSFKALVFTQIGHIHLLKGDLGLARDMYQKSAMCFGDYPVFFKNIEKDLPILMEKGVDSDKWYHFLDEIKNPQKTYLKKYLNKINNFFKKNIIKKIIYQGATHET